MNSRFLFPAMIVSVFGLSVLFAVEQEKAGEKNPETETDTPDLSLEQPVALDNIHHLMEYVFEPSYKRLKVTMAAEPTDKAVWKDIKSDSLSLAEAINLLFDRAPDEGAGDWVKRTVETRKAGNELYQAARQRDFAAARDAYEGMLKRCNSCHDQFADGDYQLKP